MKHLSRASRKRSPCETKTRSRPSSGRSHSPRPPMDPTELSRIEELEGLILPPLDAKVHAHHEMHDVAHTLDDERRQRAHHPEEAMPTEFDVDLNTADAAADFAADFGVDFLEGATRGQDRSDLFASRQNHDVPETPLVLEEEQNDLEEIATPQPQRPLRPSSKRRSKRRRLPPR